MTLTRAVLATALTLLPGVMLLASTPAPPAKPQLPGTPKKPVVDQYWGVKVTDDYRWLEDWNDPAVRAWSDAENIYARSVLDGLPGRAAIAARVEQLEKSSSASYGALVVRGGILFAMKFEPPKQQPMLVTLPSADDPAGQRVVVDPNTLDASGSTAIDFYVPSRDGKLVAVSLSKGGSESGDVHVFETATGRETGDVVNRVNGGTAGGSVAWNADGTGFYYTRYPRHGERPSQDIEFYQQVYFHRLDSDPARDVYAVGEDFPRIAETVLRSSDDGSSVLAQVANGDGGQFAFYLLRPGSGWTRIAAFEDKVVGAVFAPDGSLLLLSRQGAPRGKVLRLAAGAVKLADALTLVPEGDDAIQGFLATPTRLYVAELAGGPGRVRVFDLAGKPLGEVPLPPVSGVGQIARVDGDAVLIHLTSFLEPPAWYRYDPATGKLARTALFETSPASFSDCEVVREMVTSKDGTKVPLSIIRRKATKLDGHNPTLLTGYGGFGISLSPGFSPARRVWLEQGGVYAIANLRGGGEFGEAWHDAGRLTHKQNVFDDFLACARYLVAAGYTDPRRLAIEGGSNGGLLMGAALTQAPGLFRAVVSHVGIYDMLRVELSSNGAFNTTEYGTVKDRAQFEALYGYSPYHHVKDHTAYPAVLFLTGANDPRVDPMQSRKMTARLQAATSSGRPVLLRTSSGTGHGIGSPLSARIAQAVDVYAFLFRELGVTYHPVAPASR